MPAVALIFALLLALSAQFGVHTLLVEHPEMTSAAEIIVYLLLSAGVIAFTRLGLRWIGQRRWAAATAFAVTLLFLPWWALGIVDVINYPRPVWIIVIRVVGLMTVLVVAWMTLRKLTRP